MLKPSRMAAQSAQLVQQNTYLPQSFNLIQPKLASTSLPMSPQMKPADMREPVLRTSSGRLMRKPVHVREDI